MKFLVQCIGAFDGCAIQSWNPGLLGVPQQQLRCSPQETPGSGRIMYDHVDVDIDVDAVDDDHDHDHDNGDDYDDDDDDDEDGDDGDHDDDYDDDDHYDD